MASSSGQAQLTPPEDIYASLEWNMSHAHDVFKVGYDNILRLLENPPVDDMYNFLGYCLAWAVALEHHHDVEEAVVFPFLNSKLDFSHEIEQHKGIHDPLSDLISMMHEAQKDVAKFDSQKIAELKSLMLGLRDPLFTHLDEEVSHIPADALRVFPQDDIKKMLAKMDAWAKSHGDPFLNVPFMRSHTPPELKEVFPAIPWLVRKVVIPYVLAKRHSGYWKYAPYALS
ncbi:hypothetical protein K474DRAFT_1669051 [Panus rudis PR-1116 ss-1]|nr:hypothetical protein K474DRAFT_1669051 [Panus rudis PR-1116 ss-1]